MAGDARPQKRIHVTMAEAKPLVSVVLSFRNEEQTLPELAGRLHSVLRALPLQYELIFVNDDSLDGSLEVLLSEAEADSRVKVVNMSRRFGVYECMMGGLGYASGDAVITIDSDLQDPPEVIPALVEKWHQGADVAYTVRLSRAGESAAKIWLTYVAYRAIRWVSDVELPVGAGDYKLMSRRVVDRVLEMNEVNPYLRGLVAWIGFRQEAVYYHREPRFAGSSRRSILFSSEPAKVFFAGMAFSSLFPMALFLFLGLAALVTGALAGLALVVLSFAGVPFAGWLWALAPMFVLSGLQLCGLGAVGLYVNSVLHQVRRRPQYIVASTIGLPRDQTAT